MISRNHFAIKKTIKRIDCRDSYTEYSYIGDAVCGILLHFKLVDWGGVARTATVLTRSKKVLHCNI